MSSVGKEVFKFTLSLLWKNRAVFGDGSGVGEGQCHQSHCDQDFCLKEPRKKHDQIYFFLLWRVKRC